LVVRDSGPGIPTEALPKIWAPFFTTRAQGTGLGLAFVREIVQDHGGSIAVTTSAAGTSFELTLPASPAPR
jgi:signal transduction histidine kinase